MLRYSFLQNHSYIFQLAAFKRSSPSQTNVEFQHHELVLNSVWRDLCSGKIDMTAINKKVRNQQKCNFAPLTFRVENLKYSI